MNLFYALVAVYLNTGVSKGESLYLATGAMHKILSDLPRAPASEYVIALFNTHKKTVAKKSMMSEDKDKKITVIASDAKKKLTIAMLNMQSVLENAELKIMTFKLPEVLPMPEIPSQDAVHGIKPKHIPIPVKHTFAQQKNIPCNYNLRNARRRTR